MEKDSFEKQLRNKVLQAESALSQNTDKERVWNSIQRKQQPRRKLYYAAAAIFFLLSLVSVMYVKQDKTIVTVAKTKHIRKPVAGDLPKPKTMLKVEVVEQLVVPNKVVEGEQIFGAVKQIENAEKVPERRSPKEIPLTEGLPKAAESAAALAITNIENKPLPIAPLTIVPEFTIQFKRGISITNSRHENLMITTLKKFKLKRDTTYFANAEEKHPIKIKLSFRKEN